MEKQFVIFHLNQESFGLPIETVESIIKHQPITSLPQTHHYIEGVINLRGKIIPIMNLRERLGLEDQAINDHTRIVITKLHDYFAGLIVDGVDEVVHLETDALEEVPKIATSINQKYIQAVAKQAERIIILLELNQILDTQVGLPVS